MHISQYAHITMPVSTTLLAFSACVGRCASFTSELLLQLEWKKLTGSGATSCKVAGVMLGHPF